MTPHLCKPWLICDLGAEHRVFSWALNMPGFAVAHRVIWRELRNADLPPERDVNPWLRDELAGINALDAPCFLTSRRIDTFETARITQGQATADCVATVGLSNAERVGTRVDRSTRDWNRDIAAGFGTINIAAKVDQGLSITGLIEALSIVVQARTAAVMDAKIALPTGIATGTGTDCALIAAPAGATPQDYAGLHTDIGAALGGAVYDAVLRAALGWKATVGTWSEG